MSKNNDLTLVIMAAGMGSRFGGLKQIEPIGPNNEFIIDYSIYDAIKVGFNKIVFIIKQENYDLFRDTVGKRIESKIKVEYIFQTNDNLPLNYKCPPDRVKPLGTAHAILMAKDKVHENFAIINADDFYGRDAFVIISNFLKQSFNGCKEQYAMVGYLIENTLTDNGSVKRGVCEARDGYLIKIIESKVIKENGIITATPLDGSKPFTIKPQELVSMNMFGFTPEVFKYLEDGFERFLVKNKNNLETVEYLIPDVVLENITKDVADVRVLPTTAKWHGITYKEDTSLIIKEIQKLILSNEYPDKLWNE